MKARLHIGIYAECPHCGMDCSLMDTPYDFADYFDSAIDSLKYGKEINLEIGCVHCGEDFNINKIEWRKNESTRNNRGACRRAATDWENAGSIPRNV